MLKAAVQPDAQHLFCLLSLVAVTILHILSSLILHNTTITNHGALPARSVLACSSKRPTQQG